MSGKSAWNIGRPLRDAEVEALGYRIQPNGSWKLVDPDARPGPRKGLCRGCQKFEAMFGGICAGCAYFGLGDPHGLRVREVTMGARPEKRAPKEQAEVEEILRRLAEVTDG